MNVYNPSLVSADKSKRPARTHRRGLAGARLAVVW
jgi:hypothetical protein